MAFIGYYRGYEVYLADYNGCMRECRKDRITVNKDNGDMYFCGKWVGSLNLRTYDVLKFDEKRINAEVVKETIIPVPACVAESSTTGEDVRGVDAFFALVAKDIEDTLSGVKDWDIWGQTEELKSQK